MQLAYRGRTGRKHCLATFALASIAAALCWPLAVQAQGTYPSKPVTLVVPQTAGGLVDNFTRSMASYLGTRMGQPFVVENRTGASQAIGAQYVARAAPDGYTLFVAAQSVMVLNVVASKSVPYDPVRDFQPVSLLFKTPFYLVTNNKLPVHSIQDLIALAKQSPGKLTYASTGRGSGHHFAAEMFKMRTGTNLLHIPYKGSAPAMTDLQGGQVDVMFEGGASTLPLVKAGKIRALGSTGVKRSEAAPDLPAIDEVVPGYDVSIWVGVFAPAGTPRAVVDRINSEVAGYLKLASTHEQGKAVGIEVGGSTPEELGDMLKKQLPEYREVVKQAGIEPE